MTRKYQSINGILCTLITGCCLATHAVQAQDQDGITTQVEMVRKDSASIVPPASEIDTLLLIEAVRGCLSISVDHLLKLCETNYMTFAIPPRTTKKVIGYEEQTTYVVTNWYRTEVVQVPVYKDIYEEYETFAVGGGSSTSARSLQKIKAKRLVGREKIGTREEPRNIADTNGPLSAISTHVRYGKPIFDDGQDIYQAGVIGANALVYTALRKCGVPETHPVMDFMMREFERLLNDHAIPDYTWDVAWLTAAFCNNRQDRYKELREWLVSKLVDGQIEEGPGRGFWGPLCIDTTLVPSMLAYEQKLNEDRKAAQASLKEKPDDMKRQQRVDEAEAELERFALSYRFITQQGLRFDDCTSRYNATVRPNIIPPISVTGLPYYYFNQTLADMESTFYALYAIREAHENGFLPEETKRIITAAKRPVAPPEKPIATLARMAAALTARQKPNGQWDECNTHQPITAFAALGLPDLLPGDLLTMESPVTHLSTAQGFACLLNAGRVVGLERLFSRYGAQAEKAMQAQQDAARSFLEGQTAGRAFEPYDFFLAARGMHRNLGGNEETNRDLWIRMAYKLVSVQNPNGTWAKDQDSTTIYSSSMLQFVLKQAELLHNRRQAKLEPDKRTEFNSKAWLRQYSWHVYEYMASSRMKTAMAILFLSDGVRMPAAGYVRKADSSRTPPPVMAKVLELFQARDKVDVTHISIDASTSAANLTGIPVVFVTADSDLVNPAINKVLRHYCDNGGTIVAEIATSAQIQGLQSALLSLIDGGTIVPVPENDPCFANFSGPKPKLNAIANIKGRPSVYIIPLDTIPASPAVQTAYLLVKNNVAYGYFDNDYAWKLSTEQGAAMRIQALSQLKAEASLSRTSGKMVTVTDATVKTDTGTIVAPAAATPAPAAPPAPAGPKPDEVW
jgi:hypothetical protein